MNNLTIAITTFSKRFSYVSKLVEQIRSYTNYDIIISINGDYKLKFNDEYRRQMLTLCNQYDNVYPIFFPEQRGLSKLWNTMIIHSKDDWCLLLNDDVEIVTSDIFNHAQNIINDCQPDLLRVNGSFSHFFIHKKCIDELGYFDERLLGFGEEDGDMFFRYIQKYNKWIHDIHINGVHNLIIDIRDENITPSQGMKYTKFNRDFCFANENPKYVADPNGIKGCFGFEMRQNLSDLQQYPYEQFFFENKYKI